MYTKQRITSFVWQTNIWILVSLLLIKMATHSFRPTTIYSIVHCSPTALYSIVRCRLTALYNSVHCRPTALYSIVHCRPTALYSIVHCRPTALYNIVHCLLVFRHEVYSRFHFNND